MQADDTGPRLDQTRILTHSDQATPSLFPPSCRDSANAATLQRSEPGFDGDQTENTRSRRQDIVNNANRKTDNYIATRAPW
jgi:hypothetical protein